MLIWDLLQASAYPLDYKCLSQEEESGSYISHVRKSFIGSAPRRLLTQFPCSPLASHHTDGPTTHICVSPVLWKVPGFAKLSVVSVLLQLSPSTKILYLQIYIYMLIIFINLLMLLYFFLEEVFTYSFKGRNQRTKG